MQDLSKIGITKDEYAVYKAILKDPPQNLSKLADEVKITRVTLYKVLENLENKRLIKKVNNTVTKVKYHAASPDIFLDFIEKYKEESNDQFNTLIKQIPLLKSLEGDKKNLDDSDILVLRGENTLAELDNLILSVGEQVYGFTYKYHINACFKFDKEYNLKNNSYLDVVLKCGDKFVFPADKESIDTAKLLIRKNPFIKNKWQPRWIDAEKFKMKINFYCFGDNIAFSLGNYNEKDFLAYVVKNKDITDSMKALSVFLWGNAHPI